MYNEISSLYHLVYPDWGAAIEKQSKAYFDTALELLGNKPERVLDVSCGIGTQALGLARLGCSVTASDLSSGAVDRARAEASKIGINIDFSVVDMRDCYAQHGGGFDLVLSADNSIPHLAGDDELRRAIHGMYQCLRPGGVVLIGVREYKAEEQRSKGQVMNYGSRQFNGHRYVVFQTRDWEEDRYEVGMYFVREATDTEPAEVVCGKSMYYAVAIESLTEILRSVGFSAVTRLDGVTHNVLLSGKK